MASHASHSDYPQVAYERNGKQLVNEPITTHDSGRQPESGKRRQFFGVSASTFLIILGLLVLVVGAGKAT